MNRNLSRSRVYGRTRKKHREQVQDQAYDFHPQILRKTEATNDGKEKTTIKVETKLPLTRMNHSVDFIKRNAVDSASLQPFLDPDNNNFYVVGVAGMKDSGKTTIMNLIANGKLKSCGQQGHISTGSPFYEDFKIGNGMKAFITSNRVFLLDSGTILCNTNCREFIMSESDDYRQLITMFCSCHELLIVINSSHEVMNLIRMIICAKNMTFPCESNRLAITLIENQVQVGSAPNPLITLARTILIQNGISDSIKVIQVPKLTNDQENLLEDLHQLRDDINTRKEKKAFHKPSETEKIWLDRIAKMSMEGNFFLKNYQALSEKYYQPSEGTFIP